MTRCSKIVTPYGFRLFAALRVTPEQHSGNRLTSNYQVRCRVALLTASHADGSVIFS
jgi:hypothetical protein